MTVKVDRNNVDAEKPADKDKDLFITVFTDGSHCPHTKAWGIGIWYRDGSNPPRQFTTGGVGMRDSNQVELYGLNTALKLILDECDLADRVIVFQCDNINAINAFDYKALKKKGAKFVKMKHVKAHTSHRTRRTTVNKIVDRLAKKEMEVHRNTVTGNK